MAGLTAYDAIIKKANIQPGQSIFINGGSTSVGAYAIQIAKHKGARVTASASGKNEDFVRRMGADQVSWNVSSILALPLVNKSNSLWTTPKFLCLTT